MLKKIIIGLIGLIVALLLIAFVLPSKVEVSKSIFINAPAQYAFEEINNLEKNPKWSYWNSVYPDMTVTYGDIKAGAGAFSAWDGPKAGKGSMTVTESIPYSSIKVDLDFMDEGTGKSWYTFEPEGDGTKLTTGMSTDLGMNPIGRWMGALMFKPEMKKAFEYSLSKLKEIAEAKPKFTINITEEKTQPISYIGISSTMSTQDHNAMSAQMGKSYGELMKTLKASKVEMIGYPFCLYPRWDEEKKEMDMVCALPVAANAKLPAKYKVMQLSGGRAIKATHMGNYDNLEETHNQLNKYIEIKNLTITGAPWEVYVTDPGNEPDTLKWVTEVYYPVKEK